MDGRAGRHTGCFLGRLGRPRERGTRSRGLCRTGLHGTPQRGPCPGPCRRRSGSSRAPGEGQATATTQASPAHSRAAPGEPKPPPRNPGSHLAVSEVTPEGTPESPLSATGQTPGDGNPFNVKAAYQIPGRQGPEPPARCTAWGPAPTCHTPATSRPAPLQPERTLQSPWALFPGPRPIPHASPSPQ